MRIIFCILGCLFTFCACKNYSTIQMDLPVDNQIIANHSIIDDFDRIPEQYIEQAKKMMIFFPGESHSQALRDGMKLLQEIHSGYACNIDTSEPLTDKYVRVNQYRPVGEAEWFTWHAYPEDSRPPQSNTIKNLIAEHNNSGNPIHVIGFGWCWDLFARRSRFVLLGDRISGRIKFKPDPEFGVHWYGASIGGPDGNREWGLNPDDFKETANRVNLETYLKATEDYIEFCRRNNYITSVVFTTGPADSFTGEAGYQGFLKHQYIRNYVAKDSTRILFDYNDILCHDDDGSVTTTTWMGHTYPVITPANLGDGSIGHIGPQGAIRLAKAQWWMLARLAGWDGK